MEQKRSLFHLDGFWLSRQIKNMHSYISVQNPGSLLTINYKKLSVGGSGVIIQEVFCVFNYSSALPSCGLKFSSEKHPGLKFDSVHKGSRMRSSQYQCLFYS